MTLPGNPNPAPNPAPIPRSPNDDPPPANPTPPADPPAPTPTGVVSMTQEQFNERLARERRSHLKSLGFESEEQALNLKKQQEEAEKKRQEEERAKLSETERYRQDYENERRKNQQRDEELAALKFENHVTKACTELGVKNVDYAIYEVMRAADSAQPGAPPLDVKAYLTNLASSSDMKRMSLGLDVVQPTPTQNPVPVHSSPDGNLPPAPPPPPPNNQNPTQNVFDMDAGAWAARKQALGIT